MGLIRLKCMISGVMRQAGGPIEKYYNDLQNLWHEIDFRRLNPMKCVAIIQSYRKIEFTSSSTDWMTDRIRFGLMCRNYNHFLRLNRPMLMFEEKISKHVVMTSGAVPIPGVVMMFKGFNTGRKSNPPSKPKAQSDGGKCTHCGSVESKNYKAMNSHKSGITSPVLLNTSWGLI